MRVKNRLLNYKDYYIYQDNDYFLFSLDSVLLANFVSIKITTKKIIDFCSGNASVPMLISFRTKANINGVEIQEYIYNLGIDSVKLNKLDKQIELYNYDVKDIDKYFQSECFDVVTCNPPYFKYLDTNLTNKNIGKTIARHEVKLTLEDVIEKGSYVLKNKGTLALVHL